MRSLGWIKGVWVLAVLSWLTSCATQFGGQGSGIGGKEPDAATKAKVQAAYGKLPLHFEANQGQSDGQVKFLSRGNGYTLFLTSNEAVLALHEPYKNSLAPVSGERVRVRGRQPALRG